MTVILLFLLLILNYLRFRNLLYPPVMLTAVWLCVTGLLLLNADAFNAISDTTYSVVVGGVFAFSAGSFIAVYQLRNVHLHSLCHDSSPTLYSRLLSWISIAGLPFFLAKAYSLSGGGSESGIPDLTQLRYQISEVAGAEGYGALAYLVTISFASAAIQTVRFSSSGRRIPLLISIGVAVIYSVFSTGRTYLVFLCSMCLGILLITRTLKTTTGLALMLLFFAGAFGGIGLIMGKIGSQTGDLAERLFNVWEAFKYYFLTPLPAFDHFMSANDSLSYGSNVFRSVLAAASGLGADIEVPQLIKEYAFVPMPTNVYTVHQPYYADFGIIGVLVAQFLFGLWHGFLFRKATTGRLYFVFLYAIFLYPLIMQFFQDQYFSLLSMWVQFILLFFFYCYRIRLRRDA